LAIARRIMYNGSGSSLYSFVRAKINQSMRECPLECFGNDGCYTSGA
jgi:hypothetical protein